MSCNMNKEYFQRSRGIFLLKALIKGNFFMKGFDGWFNCLIVNIVKIRDIEKIRYMTIIIYVDHKEYFFLHAGRIK